MNLDLRVLEKSDKFGFMFYISYEGNAFHSFDEVSGKDSVKSTFGSILESFNFTWAKGIQQGGRTDAKVSANENILYMSSKYSGDLEKLRNSFNSVSKHIKIKKIVKTLPNLAFPEEVIGREYIYSYPLKKIKNSEEEIIKRAEECSGTYDVSKFTDNKGKNLKEHVRSVVVRYENNKLYFSGDSFMPKQVRIMSNYILNDELLPLPGKYLLLNRIILNKDLENMYINNNNEIKEKYSAGYSFSEEDEFFRELLPLIEKIENLGDSITIFYVKKEVKGNFIGKNGVISKKLKKLFGKLIIKEV